MTKPLQRWSQCNTFTYLEVESIYAVDVHVHLPVHSAFWNINTILTVVGCSFIYFCQRDQHNDSINYKTLYNRPQLVLGEICAEIWWDTFCSWKGLQFRSNKIQTRQCPCILFSPNIPFFFFSCLVSVKCMMIVWPAELVYSICHF